MASDEQRLTAALAALERAPGGDPSLLRAAALVEAAQGRSESAIALVERALALDPNYAAGLITLGNLLLEAGRSEEARLSLQRAVELAPQDAVAWHWLGRALQALDRLDEAAAAQQRSLVIDGGYRDAWRFLGFAREADGDLIGALQAYERAQALHYEPRTALHMALLAPYYATDMAQIDWARRRLAPELQRLAQSGFAADAPHRLVERATGLYAYWGGEDLPLHRAFAGFWRRVTPDLCWTAPHIAHWQPPAGHRPRVAYVTHFIFNHTVDRMFGGIARRLPELGFELRVFSSYAGRSPERAQIEAAAGPIVTLPDDLAAARQAIADFAPDIAIYPELGLHPFTYFLAFARLAPLQITSWGHAATSGLDSIDVFLGSSMLDPPGAERFYSEELVRLDPPPVSYQPHLPVVSADARTRLSLPPDARLYVCTQSLLKLTPDFDAVLATILARDERGLAVIVGRAANQSIRILQSRLAAAIPDWQGRVRLIDRLSDEDFVALLRSADAVLDTHGFAGGSTSYDLITLGCPFVTLPGEASKGRVGAMLYRAIGVEELIARDVDHYVELAVRLAQDRDWHAGLSARLTAAAPLLADSEPGLQRLADWLRRRVSRPRA
jgi:predicted O-linked N-acetylglucosamine transferase (SPINDLY family)